LSVLIVALASAGCLLEVDPRKGFLDDWLETHAPLLGARSRGAVVRSLIDSEKSTGADAFLVLAVIEQESRYDPRARSPKGARGLMQLLPETASHVAERELVHWSGPGDLDDPSKSVRIGAAYLAELKQQFGSWKIALSAYHSGPTRIRRITRRGGRVPTRYASRVLERRRRIDEAFRNRGR
jgi:soluble lytic murein transglycosylase-like protein